MDSSESWNAAYNEIRAANSLDTSYAKVEFEILQHLELLRRDARVRVKQWLQKFRQETANAVWKRNRNTHARLLLEQLRAGRLTHPFTSMPGPGSLPTLGRWTLAPFLTPQKKPAIPREGSAADMGHAATCPARLPAAHNSSSSPLATTSGLGGMALEAYCGRHAHKAALQETYRNLPRLEEPWRRSASPSAAPRTDSPCREPHDHQHSGGKLQQPQLWLHMGSHTQGTMLAGTHMRFTSAGAAARADPAIVCARQGSAGRDWGADGGKQGAQSTVGLEAALGACREKALELELRLRAAEQQIQAQALEKQQQEKRIAKKDVDRVIDKFERQRGRWSSPQRREFEDITQQLGDFQKATEQLKKHMSSAAAAERFLSPQQLLAAPGNTGDWLDASEPVWALSASQNRLPERASDAASAQRREHAESSPAAADSSLAAQPSIEGLKRGESVGVRSFSALHEDELAEFSTETQTLLRQIHAISI